MGGRLSTKVAFMLLILSTQVRITAPVFFLWCCRVYQQRALLSESEQCKSNRLNSWLNPSSIGESRTAKRGYSNYIFAVLLSPVLDGFDQLLSFFALSLLSINSATSRREKISLKKSWKRRDSNPGQLGYGAWMLPLCYAAPQVLLLFLEIEWLNRKLTIARVTGSKLFIQ